VALIMYFGKLSSTATGSSETVHLSGDIADSQALRAWLDNKHGFNGALAHKSVRTAINGEIVVDPHPVSNGDEIAFLPPVGGG
jgi:sulfur-carrier protein